jgi:hypothetical protein
MKHILKIWPQYYCRVADGSKTFEVRNNDRGFQPGDIVFLKEWDNLAANGNGKYTDRDILKFTVGYVLPIDAERVVFSLLPMEKK